MANSDDELKEKLKNLHPNNILELGELNPKLIRKVRGLPKNNLAVILTGERREHYAEGHPEVVVEETKLPSVIFEPDFIYHDKNHHDRIHFTKRLNEKYFLRAVVWLSENGSHLKHSVLNFQVMRLRDVRKMKSRLIYRRPGATHP